MKHITTLFAAATLLLGGLTSCHQEQPFTIHGRIEVPDSLQEHLAAMDGMPIYLIDLRGERIDSTECHEGTFTLSGTVGEPCFAYIGGGYEIISMLVLEPGELTITYDEDGALLSGTPINESISEFEAELSVIRRDAMERVEALAMAEGVADSVLRDEALRIYIDFSAHQMHVMDSVALAHPNDLVGVYAANSLTAEAMSPEMLEEALAKYSDFIRGHELMEIRLEYLHDLNSGSDELDPAYYNLEDLGLSEGE